MPYRGFVLLCLFLLPVLAGAQVCDDFYYLQPEKRITVSLTDRKGAPAGSYQYTVKELRNTGNVLQARVHSEAYDEQGKPLSETDCSVRCTGGNYLVDMKLLLPKQQAEQFRDMDSHNEFYLEYPAVMKVGESLRDGVFNAAVRNDNGLEMNLEMFITERNVQAEEMVTTAAGSWKAFRISARVRVRTMVSGVGIPFTIEHTEWFVPDFGVVRTQSKWGSSEITAIQ